MTDPKRFSSVLINPVTIALSPLASVGCTTREPAKSEDARKLSHEETLEWIQKNQAWRRAKKTKPLWARAVDQDEIGKEFQTADHALERAKEGYWLCVGTAGEPWFQKPERFEAKYDPAGDEKKQFAFDASPHAYRIYKPKETLRNWVAQVSGPSIAGFYIKPNYDMDQRHASAAEVDSRRVRSLFGRLEQFGARSGTEVFAKQLLILSLSQLLNLQSHPGAREYNC